jgi:hypothetical protein
VESDIFIGVKGKNEELWVLPSVFDKEFLIEVNKAA